MKEGSLLLLDRKGEGEEIEDIYYCTNCKQTYDTSMYEDVDLDYPVCVFCGAEGAIEPTSLGVIDELKVFADSAMDLMDAVEETMLKKALDGKHGWQKLPEPILRLGLDDQLKKFTDTGETAHLIHAMAYLVMIFHRVQHEGD